MCTQLRIGSYPPGYIRKPAIWLRVMRRLRSAVASAQCDQSLRCQRKKSSGPLLPNKHPVNTDQTGQMHRLIRIHHECEGGIEKSVLRITFLHHEACRLMTNGDSKKWIFLFHPHTNNGFFFVLTTVFFI